MLLEPLLIDDVDVANDLLLALDLLGPGKLLGREETRGLNVLILSSLFAIQECPDQLCLSLLDQILVGCSHRLLFQ